MSSVDSAGERSAALPVAITAATLLDAMDGVAYLVDPPGRILAVGRRRWTEFATCNGAPDLAPEKVVGRSLFEMVGEVEVIRTCRKAHEVVSSGRRPLVSFDYRCDSPETERHMRLAVTPVGASGRIDAVLYQSQTMTEIPRPPMPLFSIVQRFSGNMDDSRMVTLCSYCHDVAWPIGADAGRREWISPEIYYQRGGHSDVVVSHGICPDCYQSLSDAMGEPLEDAAG